MEGNNPNTDPQPNADPQPGAEPNANDPAKGEAAPAAKSEPVKAADTPSQEELAAFRKWQESQQSEAEKQAAAIGKADKARAAAEERAEAAELKLTALSKGVSAEALNDVIALAKTKITDFNPRSLCRERHQKCTYLHNIYYLKCAFCKYNISFYVP